MNNLNKWIAEEVMGWIVVEGHNPVEGVYFVSDRHDPINFTTDMNLAMKAVGNLFMLGNLTGAAETKGKTCEYMWEWDREELGNDGFDCDEIDQIADFSLFHENPATLLCLAIYKLKTGKDWEQND